MILFTLPLIFELVSISVLGDEFCQAHVGNNESCLANFTVLKKDKCEKELYLANYSIKYMPNFPQMNIRLLNLSNNLLQSIPRHSFRNLTSIEVLDLNCNKILLIHDEAFGNVSCLKAIHLRNNKLGIMHLEIFKLSSIYIDLNDNKDLCLICETYCEDLCDLNLSLSFSQKSCQSRAPCENYLFLEVNCEGKSKTGCFSMTTVKTTTELPNETAAVSDTTEAIAHNSDRSTRRTEAQSDDTMSTMMTEKGTEHDTTTTAKSIFLVEDRTGSAAAIVGKGKISFDWPDKIIYLNTKNKFLSDFENVTLYWILGSAGVIFNILTIMLAISMCWKINVSFSVVRLSEESM